MISVVIPTLNAETRLAASLEALIAPTVSGLVREVIIVDGHSADATAVIAEGFGAKVLTTPPSRGAQLAAGARLARSEWLLFLHSDTVLDPAWETEARAHIADHGGAAGVFKLAFDARKPAARWVAAGAMLRTKIFKLPYGDQGLLISRSDYAALGGYKEIPLFEDVDFIRRFVKSHGRKRLRVLPANATTSAARYEQRGYARCVFSNLFLLMRYWAGAKPDKLAKAYH